MRNVVPVTLLILRIPIEAGILGANRHGVGGGVSVLSAIASHRIASLLREKTRLIHFLCEYTARDTFSRCKVLSGDLHKTYKL